MRYLLVLCTLPLLLAGCAGMLVSAGTQAGITAAENRSVGRKLDDTVIYTDLTNQFIQADRADLLAKVTFNVRYARVMLTGNVKSEEDAQKAVELSWKAKGVTEVINELNVNAEKTIVDTAGDAIIKRNLEARLLITKGVWVINYSIDVTNATAYLIGRVKDQAELDRALNVTRTTKGVKRVISHLQINADTTLPTAEPIGGHTVSPSYSAGSTSSSAGEIYTGPVYGADSISSAPLAAPAASSGSSAQPFGTGPSVPESNDIPSGGY